MVSNTDRGRIELTTQRAAVGNPGLTRRELEVAALVAEGLTNRQIADRLFISERTADSHLEQIRQKLGVSTRSRIATWVARQQQTRPGDSIPNNLPIQLTSFVGRGEDLAVAERMLDGAHLLT